MPELIHAFWERRRKIFATMLKAGGYICQTAKPPALARSFTILIWRKRCD